MKTTERQVTAVLEGPPYATRLSTRNLEWTSDEPAIHGGADKGASPHEMLLGALAACMTITMRMYADRKSWHAGSIGVEAHLERVQEGREVKSHIRLRVQLDPTLPQEQRDRLLQIAQACPVHRTLQSPITLAAELA